MKKDIILLLLVFLTASCNAWLDIEPKSQIDKDKLYSDETGFQNALNGIYQAASKSELYGKNMTWGVLGAMSQVYDPESLLETEGYFAELTYDNKESKPVVATIWEKMYKLIANCNLLLKEVTKASPSIFTLDTISKNVITGEALALRAFFHFDIVRLYAPAPASEGSQKPLALIPYQAEWPSEIKKKLTATEALDEVVKDLLQAKDLLAFNDTLYNATAMKRVEDRIDGANGMIKGGKFMNNRGYRLNYCAVLGMLARVYMYKGDRENAFKYAYEFYNTFVVNKKWFKWNASYDFTGDLKSRKKKHLSDCLFTFYNFDLLDNYADYKLWSGDPAMQIQGVDEIFGNDLDDYRLQYLLDKKEEYGEYIYWSIKYQRISGDANINRDEGRALPNLRVSEIYYILIECFYRQGRTGEALSLLKELRNSRGCKREITSIDSEAECYDLLLNDARREFIGEGQLFFMYKRLNRPILTVGSEIAPSTKVFVFDIPNSQNVF